MSELHFPAPPLADEAVLLRPWRDADVSDGLMAFSDSVIQRFSWPQTTPFTEEDARDYFDGQESRASSRRGGAARSRRAQG